MTVYVELPQGAEKYVEADGRLTLEGLKLIQRLVEAIKGLDSRVTAAEIDIDSLDVRMTAAEATLADHETRIVALEP